jgi:hypothetical protein
MSTATDHPTTLTRRAILAGASAIAAAAALPASASAIGPNAKLPELAALTLSRLQTTV